MKNKIKMSLMLLPQEIGVYQFFDDNDNWLYVGKAKNLKKRVSSYFTKNHSSTKVKLLVKKITYIKHIVVETETDALLLENSLIKTHQPQYNVLLKDGKTYPWICIKKERFPRVFLTRQLVKDGSEYFGPYTCIKTIRTLKRLIRELYSIRVCNYDLSEEKIAQKKFKVCLEYHIKNCLGPCEGLQTEDLYNKQIQAIKNILKGNFKESLKALKQQMNMHSKALQFEEAQHIKLKIDSLKNYQSKSTIVNPKISDVDVFSIFSDVSYAYINFLQISYGTIIRSNTVEVLKRLEESDSEVLEFVIIQLRKTYNSLSKEIINSVELSNNLGIKCVVPKLGEKKKLIELSLRNAKTFRLEKLNQQQKLDPKKHTNRLMRQMLVDLKLKEEPRHIECFDNSNLQGTNPVAACVVFKNGKPSKKDYRKFHIKTVVGIDDFASMEEVVYRRYKRLLVENQPLPQLIIVDGGKGQLSSALKSIKRLNLETKVSVLGIAKRLEEIFCPNDPYPLHLSKSSETLKVIQQMRNEAHRVGIIFHRKKRIKNAITTQLTEIESIGIKTAEKLLKKYKSINKISQLSLEDIGNIIDKDKAQRVYLFFHKKS